MALLLPDWVKFELGMGCSGAADCVAQRQIIATALPVETSR